jgi:hypothetical protein
MKAFQTLAAAVSVVALASCAPDLVAGNEAGGMVSRATGMQADKAFAVADAHCRQYGKVARVSGQNIWNNTMSFDCVKP